MYTLQASRYAHYTCSLFIQGLTRYLRPPSWRDSNIKIKKNEINNVGSGGTVALPKEEVTANQGGAKGAPRQVGGVTLSLALDRCYVFPLDCRVG